MTRTAWMVLAALTVCGFSTATAQAQFVVGGPAWYGYYNVYVQDQPPYFALHPPVYYSYPVARTYGYSPFPYPGDTRTPRFNEPAPEPRTISNPYCAQGTTGAAAGGVERVAIVTKDAPQSPQRIVNPFVGN